MPETHEERLRAAFKDAAADGQRAAMPASAAAVRVRGNHKRRQRLAMIGATACVLIGGATASVVLLLPGDNGGTLPATSPAPPSTDSRGLPTAEATSDYPARTYPPTGTAPIMSPP